MTANLITDFDWKSNNIAESKVLDLACGSGRNGLWFADKGAKVHFIDRDLNQMQPLKFQYLACQFSEWDMETENAPQLATSSYDIILVFNYLHQPLFKQIIEALKPGGLLFYETFTSEQAQIGRPRNPNFLLKTNELAQVFNDWHAMHYQEGKIITSVGANESFKAQIIAQKPVFESSDADE